MALHIKKGDKVKIISGDHKGATGEVLRVMPEQKKVVIQGHNMALKHVRPSRRNPQGGRIHVEQPVHISNVLPINPKNEQASKVKFKVEKDGSKKKIASDGSELGEVKKKL